MENNNTPNNEAGGQAGFNQAYYQQIRLHEIFLRIDRCFVSPLEVNDWLKPGGFGGGVYNYKIIAADLTSAYITISAKLSKEEKNIMKQKQDEIDEIIYTKKLYTSSLDAQNRRYKIFDFTTWKLLKGLLLEFRGNVESLMEKYGFGNPSKKDPTKSSIEF